MLNLLALTSFSALQVDVGAGAAHKSSGHFSVVDAPVRLRQLEQLEVALEHVRRVNDLPARRHILLFLVVQEVFVIDVLAHVLVLLVATELLDHLACLAVGEARAGAIPQEHLFLVV